MVHYAVSLNDTVIGSRSSASHAAPKYTHALVVLDPARGASVLSYHSSERLAQAAAHSFYGRTQAKVAQPLQVVPVVVTPTRVKAAGTVSQQRTQALLRDGRATVGDAVAATRASERAYDAAQTALCDRLREHVRSIAVLGTQALQRVGDCDPLADLLDDIARDLALAQRLNDAIARDDVYADIR